MVHFNTPKKHQKTKPLLTSSGGLGIEHWAKMGWF